MRAIRVALAGAVVAVCAVAFSPSAGAEGVTYSGYFKTPSGSVYCDYLYGSHILAEYRYVRCGFAGKLVPQEPKPPAGCPRGTDYVGNRMILTLRGRAAWAHDFNPDRAINSTFQALPGASFTVNGARQASESALATASVEMKWMNGWSAAGTFEGEFSDVTRSYAGKGVVRYAW